MLGNWIKGRLDELKEGLQELQERAEIERYGTPQSGQRRSGPVYYPADPEPEFLDEPPACPPSLELDMPPPLPEERSVPPAKVALRQRLRDPARLREAIVVREILDKPVALRGRGRRAFKDR